VLGDLFRHGNILRRPRTRPSKLQGPIERKLN
jgi:hypothetical protein